MANASTSPLLKSLRDHYAQGQYQEGIDLLLTKKAEMPLSLFHYNLGTFYGKKGDLAVARYHFESAAKQGLTHPANKSNLEQTIKELRVEDLQSSGDTYDQICLWATSYPSSVFLFFFLLVSIFLLLLKKLKLVRSWALIGTFSCLSLLPFMASHFYFRKLQTAIVLKETVLREGPSKAFGEKRRLAAGSKVIIGKRNEQWFFIVRPQFLTGWAHKDDLGIY